MNILSGIIDIWSHQKGEKTLTGKEFYNLSQIIKLIGILLFFSNLSCMYT